MARQLGVRLELEHRVTHALTLATDAQRTLASVIAVPIPKILTLYQSWQKPEDLNPLRLKTIQHFFEHYKDLEPGKWVKVVGWEGPDAARAEVTDGIERFAAEKRAENGSGRAEDGAHAR